jgi:hypothetical protein
MKDKQERLLVDADFKQLLKGIAKGKKITVKTLTKRMANDRWKIEWIIK